MSSDKYITITINNNDNTLTIEQSPISKINFGRLQNPRETTAVLVEVLNILSRENVKLEIVELAEKSVLYES